MTGVTEQPILEIRDLVVDFDYGKPTAHRALDSVAFSIADGEVVGLVGESGSGKTVLAHTVLKLLPENGRIRSGEILWKKRNLIDASQGELRAIRGKEIAMIFQDPQASLNPVFSIGRQMSWVLKAHRGLDSQQAKEEVLRLLNSVRIADPEKVADKFPGQLSGGMCQRVMIAMAISCHPQLLIADESTSALDVTTQAEILELLREVKNAIGMAVLFITHDLGLASRMCDQVGVMHRGRIVESGPPRTLFSAPVEPYTRKLVDSLALSAFPIGTALNQEMVLTVSNSTH